MAYTNLRLFPDINGDMKILDPTVFSWEDVISKATSIFAQKANELMCYFCSHGEKTWLRENNWVICFNPQSPVSWKITSATNNCSQNSETLPVNIV